MTVGYTGQVAWSTGAVYAGVVPTPDTWQRYLSRLGGGINGVSNVYEANGRTFSSEDIVANAEHYMQKKYPGPYRVESYYNADKMKYDLRLRFADPRDEMMWILKWS